MYVLSLIVCVLVLNLRKNYNDAFFFTRGLEFLMTLVRHILKRLQWFHLTWVLYILVSDVLFLSLYYRL